MAETKSVYIGWIQALFSVMIFWGISNVFAEYSTQILSVNKIIFACVTFTSSSMCLLIYAGKGALSRETLRSVDTWAYGIVMLLSYIVILNLFGIVTATEGTLLQRFSVVVALFISWVFLMRKPSKAQLLGLVMVIGGLIVICYGLPVENAITVYILMFLAGIFQALRIFIAESHRPHKKAVQSNDIKSRCRVIGYVMFVISIIFSLGIALIALLQSLALPEDRIMFLIQPESFFHPASILAGMFMGIFIYAPIKYFEFSSSHAIKAENYLAVTSLSFFSTLFWEWSTQPLTGLNLKEISNLDLIAGLVITAGGILMAVSKVRQAGKKEKNQLEDYLYVESQNLEIVDDSREILANTLEHFSGDIKKSAVALGVPIETIEALLQDKDKVLAFKSSTLKKVARNYRNKVSTSDALTGILNRGGFMAEAKKLLEKAEQTNQKASLLFIDLDKFKPVNDTYGHDAGDFILKGVAERLAELFADNNGSKYGKVSTSKASLINASIITRLGGDEFCVLIAGVSSKEDKKQAKLAKLISKEIAKPFTFKGKKITIGASVGIANYPEDGRTTEELLKHADVGMYDEKKER